VYGIIVSLATTLGCAVLGYLYINFFLPENYYVAIIYLLILSLGLPPVMLQVAMQVMLEVDFRYKELSLLAILVSIFKIISILAFGLIKGVVGVCWAIVLAAWINLAFYYLLTLKGEKAAKFLSNHPRIKELVERY
jgi:Na+-driven multidrug efflux pump